MRKSTACVCSLFTLPCLALRGPPLPLVHGHQRWRCLCRDKGLFEALLYQNVKPCEFISYSPVSFSAGKPLAPTIPMGKVTFCKHCQDFYLMAKMLCRQTNASVNILSIPHGLGLYQPLPLIHKHTRTHTCTRAPTQNTAGSAYTLSRPPLSIIQGGGAVGGTETAPCLA